MRACLCGFFLARGCDTERSALYTKDLSSRKERGKGDRRVGGGGGEFKH